MSVAEFTKRQDLVPLPSQPGAGLGFAQLVSDHMDDVWRYVRCLGMPEHEADDIVQETFVIAARKQELIQRGRERAFLLGVASRVVCQARRTIRRRREQLSWCPPERATTGDAEEATQRDRGYLLVGQVIAALPEEFRAVFVLFEIEQQSTAEIAEQLDLPLGTVASRLRRARELFQEAARRLQVRLAREESGR